MVITSKIKRFPGTVAMPDFLTLPQVLAFEAVNEEVRAMRDTGQELSLSKVNAITLPFILKIVTEWKISGMENHPTIDNFPATPRLASAQLIAWVMGAVTELYIGEVEIPNG